MAKIEFHLRVAMRERDLERVKKILEQSPDLNNEEAFSNLSAIILAVCSQSLDIVKAIIDYQPLDGQSSKKLVFDKQLQSDAVVTSITVQQRKIFDELVKERKFNYYASDDIEQEMPLHAVVVSRDNYYFDVLTENKELIALSFSNEVSDEDFPLFWENATPLHLAAIYPLYYFT